MHARLIYACQPVKWVRFPSYHDRNSWNVPATSEYFRRDVRTLLEMSEDVPMTFEEFECIDTEPNVVSVKRASAAHLIDPKRMLPL